MFTYFSTEFDFMCSETVPSNRLNSLSKSWIISIFISTVISKFRLLNRLNSFFPNYIVSSFIFRLYNHPLVFVDVMVISLNKSCWYYLIYRDLLTQKFLPHHNPRGRHQMYIYLSFLIMLLRYRWKQTYDNEVLFPSALMKYPQNF